MSRSSVWYIHLLSTRLSIMLKTVMRTSAISRNPAVDHCQRRSVTFFVPTLLIVVGYGRVWGITSNNTKQIFVHHVECPLLTTTNIPYPRSVWPRVVPLASTQTPSLSRTPPAGLPSVPVAAGLSRHSHQLQLRLHEKRQANSALERFHRGQ